MLRAGVAENVLPQTAELSINFRLLPATPATDALAHVQRWLGDNAVHANVTLGPTSFAPSVVSDSTGPAFKLITAAVQEGWKYSEATGVQNEGRGVPVLPYLLPGGTDSKHYQNLTRTIMRFCPFSLTREGLRGVHGTNERISVADFVRLLCTYRAGLRLAGAVQITRMG
jgi:carboxypeptidase PM20D1